MMLRSARGYRWTGSGRRAVGLLATLALVPGCSGGDGSSDAPSDAGTDATDAASPVSPVRASITSIVAYQSIGVELGGAGGGPSEEDVPLVSGRPTLIRAFVQPEGFVQRPLVGRLEIRAGGRTVTYEATRMVSSPSQLHDLDSTFNFLLEPGDLRQEASVVVSLEEEDTAPEPAALVARWPSEGEHGLNVSPVPPPLRVVVLPIRYSGNVPDTSEPQIAALRDVLLAMFPVASVDVSVHPELLDYDSPVQSDGSGWGALVESVCVRRVRDDAPLDVVYYGMITPTPSLAEYCGPGQMCLGGAALPVFDPGDEWVRCATGLGYSNEQTPLTVAHELGHVLGRRHAPCGAPEGVDPDFPNADGAIGVWGWDHRTSELFAPSTSDLMGYCPPRWVGPYTYRGLIAGFERFHDAPSARVVDPAEYRIAQVDEDGRLRWSQSVRLRTPPMGAPRIVRLRGADGTSLGTSPGAYYPFEHGAGGLVLVRQGDDRVRLSAAVELAAPF